MLKIVPFIHLLQGKPVSDACSYHKPLVKGSTHSSSLMTEDAALFVHMLLLLPSSSIFQRNAGD
jgi:hypothetical protein